MGVEGCVGSVGVCWSGQTIKKGNLGCRGVQICTFSVCMAGKIPSMLCMESGFECGVKNDQGWGNMGADGYSRVNKHARAGTKKITHIMTPKPRI